MANTTLASLSKWRDTQMAKPTSCQMPHVFLLDWTVLGTEEGMKVRKQGEYVLVMHTCKQRRGVYVPIERYWYRI